MNQPCVAPHLRRWFREEQQRTESGFYRKRRSIAEMKAYTFYLWLAVVIAATLAVVMDANHRRHTAAYRALPSADERIMSGDYPVTHADRDAELTRMVEREWSKVVRP